jgi:hypothetical protein
MIHVVELEPMVESVEEVELEPMVEGVEEVALVDCLLSKRKENLL